ncbi:MAG: 2-oxo acid dehydrogenase subunit E2 [Hyphomicrobiales bacterium]|nr:2-oxo acid dehydrogenase subunit E2 [Hyphomicrobiales bacterium]
MAEHVIRLPDVGEGVAEAELVEWHVNVGDLVREDAVLAAVMTDKATVEIPSPVEGEITWLGAKVGDVVPVGSDLVRLKIPGEDAPAVAASSAQAKQKAQTEKTPRKEKQPSAPISERPGKTTAPRELREAAQPPEKRILARPGPARQGTFGPPRPEGLRPLASPAVRLRAREGGIDLRQVPGTGPAGRITHEDLDAFFAKGAGAGRSAGLQPKTGVEEIKLVGLRRRIAEKMATAHSHIPAITYVEEVDVTALEELRASLNKEKRDNPQRLTLLPFLMRALVRAVEAHPVVNSLFDDAAGVLHQHGGVHIGIATQTPSGLMVPVVRHAEALDLWGCAAELTRLSEAAKAGTAQRDELTGSTITITSLGALGGIISTPIINHPEIAIVGVNKMSVRPHWDGTEFVPRKMMNLSSSFDHRVIDGFDAAVFMQRLKALLETPALIFMESRA